MRTYTTQQGDAWDEIARKVYGSERFMDTLVKANPAYRSQSTLAGGLVLTVPDLPAPPPATVPTPAEPSIYRPSTLPPWKR